MRIPPRRSLVGCCALAATLTLASCGGQRKKVVTPPPELADARGVASWIAAHRGKPLLVNFWATWCTPCVAELPDLQTATRSFRARGGVVLAVAMELMDTDVDEERGLDLARGKAQQLDLDFPVLVCTEDLLALRSALGIELGALPQTVTYDRKGHMIAQHEGKATAEEFAALAAAAAAAR